MQLVGVMGMTVPLTMATIYTLPASKGLLQALNMGHVIQVSGL